MPSPFVVSSLSDAPFVVEHVRQEESRGHFIPSSHLLLTPMLRTSGLIAGLSDEAVRSLVALLTFLTPNGHIHPTLVDVSRALNLSEKQTKERLHRLNQQTWQGKPLVQEIARDGGASTYTVSAALIMHRQKPMLPVVASLPIPQVASREDVIAHSRERYGVPRAEAERMVSQQLGYEIEGMEETEEGNARRQLQALGVSRDDVNRLIAKYPLEVITRQISWMGYRSAKSPSRFIVAAIEHNYDPPAHLLREMEQGVDTQSMQAETSKDEANPANEPGRH